MIKINDTNRRVVASYLADYLLLEKERIVIPEPDSNNWTQADITNWIESGLKAYEAIHHPKQYTISRSIEDISLNGQEFLLSDDKNVRLFDSIAEAKEHAHLIGITEEDFDNVTFNICEYLPESGDYVVI